MFTRIAYFISVLLILSFTVACAESQPTEKKMETFVEKHRWLSVKGTSLTNKNGETMVLRGISLGWHNWWPRFYDETTITWLQDD
jgi:endoglucanase